MNWKMVASFAWLYTERLPTEKETPALKSKPSSLIEICSYPHGQAKWLLEKSFLVLWTEQTKIELFDYNGKRSVWGTAPILPKRPLKYHQNYVKNLLTAIKCLVEVQLAEVSVGIYAYV